MDGPFSCPDNRGPDSYMDNGPQARLVTAMLLTAPFRCCC